MKSNKVPDRNSDSAINREYQEYYDGLSENESTESKLLSIGKDALRSFKCTQKPSQYEPDHWSNRMERLLFEMESDRNSNLEN